MKKTRLITVLTVAAMLYATCGTAFSVELNLKNLKDAAKKELDQKRGAKKDGSEKENSEKQNASTDSNSNTANNKNSATATSSATAANLEPNSEDDFDWEVNDDFTEITITKYKGTRKDVVIPASIQDVPVVKIRYGAFACSRITSVVIPEGVKELGERGNADAVFYYCNQLKSLTLPSGISIGKAVWSCGALETLILGENSKIGERAFTSLVSLKTINIPKGCTLAEDSFCSNGLECVTLPEGLKIIPEHCFDNCKNLTNINFPSTLKYIGMCAFRECSLSSVELPEGLEYLGKEAFKSDAITSISLPKTLKWIEIYNGRGNDYGYGEHGPAIKGDNIASITLAEGFAPKILDLFKEKQPRDGRDLIQGASISKSIKLQKQLASIKLESCLTNRDEGYACNLTDEGKILYADLLSYGFSEKDAKSVCSQFHPDRRASW